MRFRQDVNLLVVRELSSGYGRSSIYFFSRGTAGSRRTGSLLRRLAVQSRQDEYASRRDYQETHTRISQQITFCDSAERSSIDFSVALDKQKSKWVAFGGYVLPASDVTLTISLKSGDIANRRLHNLIGSVWNRVGLCAEANGHDYLEVCLEFSKKLGVSLWGLEARRVCLPSKIESQDISLEALNSTSLAPETFYFDHERAINLDIAEDCSDRLDLSDGAEITLKKCSYCGRLLPLASDRLGALAFHKHSTKRTKHQNECRACKKWKINNSFNPLRTVDQLNESALITRERKILLREPVILQEIKDRSGDGLKSQVWKRFHKRCFYCGKTLRLTEVQLDHTRPLAYLWPIDEHATCLCAEHNNLKKDRFPVEFYSEDQLSALSKICGLPLETLKKKEVNEKELARILQDIEKFAREADPRTFLSIARKVKELKPSVDLFASLRHRNAKLAAEVEGLLAERPESVLSDPMTV